MGNCTSCSSRSVVKGVAGSDPSSVFKYDKEARKIVYVGEDNVDGEIQLSGTISASASASGSGENSDSGSITTAENNGSDGGNDHLNTNLNNVRSLLGEIAEYLDEDESTYATGSVAGSQRSVGGSVATTPTANKSHDNSVISTHSRQTVSPLLFDSESNVRIPYTNDERTKKFEELVQMSKEQKMVQSARSRLYDSPEADLVYKHPRHFYEDDSLLTTNPSDELGSPTGPNYAGREELERGQKEEVQAGTEEDFDDDQSDKTSLAGIEHVLSDDISESHSNECEADFRNLANLLPSESDRDDIPTDEEDYDVDIDVEDPPSPSPKVAEDTKASPSASDANTSNISFGSFMHVSYVEGEPEEHEDKSHQAKASEHIERDLIIFSPDVDSMRKSVAVAGMEEKEEESNGEKSSDDDEMLSHSTEEMLSHSTEEALSENDSIVTEHAVNSSMISEFAVQNKDESLNSSEDEYNDEVAQALENVEDEGEDEGEETESSYSEEEYSEEGSDATQHACNTSMVSEVVVPIKEGNEHVGNEVSYVQQATKPLTITELVVPIEEVNEHIGNKVSCNSQATKPLTITKLEIIDLSSPAQDAVPFIYEESENMEEVEEEPITLTTMEEHTSDGATEIVDDIICPPQKEVRNISNDVDLEGSDHSKVQRIIEKSKELKDEQPSPNTAATPPSLEVPETTVEELQTLEKVTVENNLKLESFRVVERKEKDLQNLEKMAANTNMKLKSIELTGNNGIEGSPEKKRDHINDDVIEREELGAIEIKDDNNSIPEEGDHCVESCADESAVSNALPKDEEMNEEMNEEIIIMNKENVTVKHPDNEAKAEVTLDVNLEECIDPEGHDKRSNTEEDGEPLKVTEEEVSSCSQPHLTEKMEDNVILAQEGDISDVPSDECIEKVEDNPASTCDSFVDARSVDEKEIKEVGNFDIPEKEESGVRTRVDTVSIEKDGAAEEVIDEREENESECPSIKEETVVVIESLRTLNDMEIKFKELESLRKLDDMESKFKELESLQYSDSLNYTTNAKATVTASPTYSNENCAPVESIVPSAKNQKMKGSVTTKKCAPANQVRPKPRTPPRRYDTPTRASILRQQHLNGNNNNSLSRGRSLTSKSRPSHREIVSRRNDDDASVGSTSSFRSSRSGRSFNQTTPKRRRNSLNLKDSPDDASVQSFRSARTPLSVTPGSLPWDEKDLRRTMSPGGSICSFGSNLSDPEFIRESRKVAHKRVVAVRSAEKEKNKKCNRKWDTTLFEKKKGCVRCLALASKKERCQYLTQGRHVSIAMTSGGCTSDCFPTKEFLRAYPELELDDDEDVRLCRICFNAIHR